MEDISMQVLCKGFIIREKGGYGFVCYIVFDVLKVASSRRNQFWSTCKWLAVMRRYR